MVQHKIGKHPKETTHQNHFEIKFLAVAESHMRPLSSVVPTCTKRPSHATRDINMSGRPRSPHPTIQYHASNTTAHTQIPNTCQYHVSSAPIELAFPHLWNNSSHKHVWHLCVNLKAKCQKV